VAALVKGEVVVLPFPFSDLSAAKRRPALVIASLPGDDVILCQITSRTASGSDAIPVSQSDFDHGGLNQDSHIRPNRLFTADPNIVLYSAGLVKTPKVQEVVDRIIQIVTTDGRLLPVVPIPDSPLAIAPGAHFPQRECRR
jgi:PemK-like, MazF-like toxin of type II toxin-antitoxin system